MPDPLEEAKRLSARISALVERAPHLSAREFSIDALPLLMETNNELAELVERLEQERAENEKAARVIHAARVYQLERASGNPTAYREAFLKLDAALVDLYHGEALAAQQREDEG